MSDEREMTLDEWCKQLPSWHAVNKELFALRLRAVEAASRIASEADAEIERLRARVALLEPVAAAARIYYRHYMQDEADDGGEQWCGHDQHERAKAVRDSLHDLEPFTVKELRL